MSQMHAEENTGVTGRGSNFDFVVGNRAGRRIVGAPKNLGNNYGQN